MYANQATADVSFCDLLGSQNARQDDRSVKTLFGFTGSKRLAWVWCARLLLLAALRR